MRRREFLGMAGAVVAAGVPRKASAQAQNWPDRPVKLILPYAPGGGTDLIGRPWAEKLAQSFGQQFIIENRGGAGGMIGTEAGWSGRASASGRSGESARQSPRREFLRLVQCVARDHQFAHQQR